MDETRSGSFAAAPGMAEAEAAASRAGPEQARVAARSPSPFGRLVDKLFEPTDAASLGAFRILFGGLMLWETLRYVVDGRIWRYYVAPDFLFTYELFPFVEPWPGTLMYGHFALMALAATGIALGLFYRVSAVLFLLTYSYVFLLDKAQYNNHYYLIILLSLLMSIVRADQWASLDGWRKGKPGVIPFWNLFVLRAQVFLVYFFGGVAKLNADWLGGEPMRTWLAQRSAYPVVGPFFTTELAPYFFSWGGALFDLSIGFLLLSKRTLPIAFLLILLFNMTNHWLFDIGVFTFLMIATTILFDDADFPRRLLGRPDPAPVLPPGDARPGRRSAVLAFIGGYLALQALIPLRHFLYPGNVSWTEEGHRFAWHMKLRSKSGQLEVWVTDPRTGKTWKAKPTDDLSARQVSKMLSRPDMILQYVHLLRDKLEREGIENAIIKVDSWMSLNRRPFQRAIDPDVDLASVEGAVFARAPWILPLDERLVPGSRPRRGAETLPRE